MLGIEGFDPVFHSVREVIVNCCGVREQGIAADVWQRAGAQDARKGRFLPERHIGVPFVCRAQEWQYLISQFQAVPGFNVQDLGMTWHVGSDGVPFQFTKVPAKANMLRMRYILIAEHKHFVAEQRLSDILHSDCVERAPQVYACNFSAENRAERAEPGAGVGGGLCRGLGSGHAESPGAELSAGLRRAAARQSRGPSRQLVPRSRELP